MKKLISFLILLALSISLFSCAKAPIDSAFPGVLIENKRPTDDALTATDVQTPDETADQTPQESADGVDADTEPDDSATVTPAVNLPSVTVKQNEGESAKPMDKAPPCDVTIDEPFSDFEVVVSFTLEESAKDKEYTPSDFAAVDCFNVFPFDYYPEDIHPEYKDRKTVILMLSEQSKQGVLDAVAVLQKDDRIYSAEPSFIIDYDPGLFDTVLCDVYLTEEELNNHEGMYYASDFPEIQILTKTGPIEPHKYPLSWCGVYTQMLIDSDAFETYKKIVSDERVKYIKATLWELIGEEPDMIRVYMKENAVFNKFDYPEIDIARIVTSDEDSVVIELANGGYKEMGKALYIFNNHPKTVTAHRHYVGGTVSY